MFPGERAYRAERQAFLATIESLTEEEFEHGTTLCAGWAPRDIAGHLVGIDEALPTYLKAAGNVNKGNARIVARMAALDRKELLDRLREWAARPAVTSLMASYGLHGDLAVHHQDVLRGLGRRRDVPAASARAILREGALFGLKRLTSHRVVPTDTGRAIGRGRVVKGTAEQLGLWLAGRSSVEPELVFATEN